MTRASVRRTFLLDKARNRSKRFLALRPDVVTTRAGLPGVMAKATKDSLWISYEQDLTEALLRYVSWPVRSMGNAVLMHNLDPRTIPALAGCFQRFVVAPADGFLPPDELAAALQAENGSDLFLAGSVDQASQTATLWRGNLQPLTVPFAAFEKSGDGIQPDFDRFSLTDCGQTIRFGDYEAAADAVLYEFDPMYRRRMLRRRRESEQSFGASLRRLRKQRGLRREDFGPEVAAKTIARIEQGRVRRVQRRTLDVIAERLRTKVDEIATY